MTMALHIYRPRRFQWTWFGVKWPSGCWVLVSKYTYYACGPAQMGKWPWRCISTGKMVPMNQSESGGCWDLASARFQEPLLYPWACPYGPDGQMTTTLHIYMPEWFQGTWFGVNQPSGCWVLASARFQELLICQRAHPCGPNGQMTMTLHIYRQDDSHWTWFGLNQPSGCQVTASARFQEHLLCPWAC